MRRSKIARNTLNVPVVRRKSVEEGRVGVDGLWVVVVLEALWDPWAYGTVAPERELVELGGTEVGEPTGVVSDAGVAHGVAHAAPRERVGTDGKVWYG